MRTSIILLLLSLTILACQNPVPAKRLQSQTALLLDRPHGDAISTASKPATSAALSGNYPDISGYYEETDLEQEDRQNEGCNIAVTMIKVKAGYHYRLTAGEMHHSGKIALERNADQSLGLVFEGIPYAEYEGDIDKLKVNDERPQPKLPVGIGGVLSGDTITIQNYGNAMNYYVKFGDCQVKFITLIRVVH